MSTRIKHLFSDTHLLTIWGIFVITLLIMAFLKPGDYFTFMNVKSIIYQFPEYGILAFGMMACMVAGGIDLSLVGIMNFTGVITALIVKNMAGTEVTGSTYLIIAFACVVAIVLGGLCGAFNGFIIGYFKIPAMLVTLCGLQLYTGLAYGITGGPAINGMVDPFKNIANGTIGEIPYVLFIFIFVLLIVAFVMKCTVLGNEIYFMGSNASAAKYSGMNILKITVITHMFSGILGGVSGILITSHLNSGKSSNGSTYTLLTLLIAVLGGVHPDGGKGRVIGVCTATILLQFIANAFGLLHMDDNAKTFANGCLLVAALLFDVYLDRKAEKRARLKAAAENENS
ncbi:MAG: ABC transporter permease [Lachnospiraceae bacterium]|nr:ABC transporter permease [Lachnospiraceae bacterium]